MSRGHSETLKTRKWCRTGQNLQGARQYISVLQHCIAMATNDDRRKTNALLKEPCSRIDDTLTESTPGMQEDNSPPFKQTHRQRRKWRIRGVGYSSLYLILTWNLVISLSVGFTITRIYYFQLKQMGEGGSTSLWMVPETALSSILSISCTIASLLAEVVISRYKLVSYSLKAMWLLSILTCVVQLCEDSLPVPKSTFFKIQFLVVVPQYLLLGGFIATAIALGIDQLSGGSDTNISAYILWLAWAFFSGLSIPAILGAVLYNCTHFLQTSEVGIVLSLLPVLLLSVGLILDFRFNHTLVKEPVTVNPISLIFKVLKYASKHKRPVQRSAFTYCENERPTRLDYGKSKYGGPFTTEQVEDVKTFWRILVVILAVSLLCVPLIANIQLVLDNFYSSKNRSSSCFQSISHKLLTPYSMILYCIPLYELLIYPCLRNRGPGILQSAGIGAAALILSSLYGLMAETVRRAMPNGTTECTVADGSHNEIDTNLLIPAKFLLGFTIIILCKSIGEFICAQAPYNMKGILIGIVITLFFSFDIIGTLLYVTWRNRWVGGLDTRTCGVWFYLTTLALAVVFSLLLGLAIRRYKARERDDLASSRTMVEDIYYKYHNQAPQE